jgi:hypothetical protein
VADFHVASTSQGGRDRGASPLDVRAYLSIPPEQLPPVPPRLQRQEPLIPVKQMQGNPA